MKQIVLDPFLNVVNNGIATCDLSTLLGSVVEKITLNLGGTTFDPSKISRIDLKANGKVIWTSTGANLKKSNAYSGGTATNTMLKIDFMDRRRTRSLNAFQAGAIDLSAGSGVTTFRLEVTISGATAPTIVGWADVTPPTNNPAESEVRWLIARRHVHTQVVGAAGMFALQIPHIDPAGGGSTYRRVYIYSTNMTGIKVQREGVTEFELTRAQNEESQKDNGMTPQADMVVFDPVQRGLMMGEVWDTRYNSSTRAGVRSAQFYGTFSDGETITIETEELLPLGAY